MYTYFNDLYIPGKLVIKFYAILTSGVDIIAPVQTNAAVISLHLARSHQFNLSTDVMFLQTEK